MWTNLDRPPLDVRALRRALVDGPQASWSRLDVVTETGSTNADLVAGVVNYADRTALIAEHQDNGRGRHSRSFSGAPRSQILLSMLLKFPGIDPAVLGWLPLMTGIALVDALRTVGEVDARLKWPNDVLIRGKKVSGILAEVAAHGPSPTVVIGLGVNVSMTADELPVSTATSLALEKAAVLDRDTLVRAILRGVAAEVDSWRDSNWSTDALAHRYRDRCGTIGQRVRVDLPGGEEKFGTAVDVDEHGRIVIEMENPDSGLLAVAAGDVTHLRPVT
ncbi:biotin--[acetyl-CoA-carboxylase] ligase [Rhodococcus sp. IEGM 1381]|uniref:biotin--[acetyl-CoA-carboxylase] ligase n=1 Tax=Rhodococcus sp. IEGM 1381 TaxID=3047085 RepID=UPI0024B68C79|nr:biotin--[acetyl-CoA-carboxylase] ligase [Rhodococcus sp. IEGM 1381]MDI9895451.1 biotin--[acetyl-CoA-carboxylase] ligase [Rhodococcus sp. IEGM 1381]